MAKPRGLLCNLSCHYCYYRSKVDLFPSGDLHMSDELLELYTRQYIAAQPGSEVTFAWQGGEPTLMGLPFFARAVALQAQYRRPGMRIANALQTNGMLLDDEWCRFLRQHDFLVGISLDGPRHLHDAYRVDGGEHGSFDRVMAGLACLRRHGVEFNVLTTVHAANAGHPLEVYRFLRDETGARFMQFIPIVERTSEGALPPGEVGERSVSGQAFGEFMNRIFDEWVGRDIGRVFVQSFDAALAAWMGERAGLCVFDETCGQALVLEHDGSVMPVTTSWSRTGASGTSGRRPWPSWPAPRRSAASDRRSATACRAPAARARCASRATVGAPRIDCWLRRMARQG